MVVLPCRCQRKRTPSTAKAMAPATRSMLGGMPVTQKKKKVTTPGIEVFPAVCLL